MPRFFFDFTTDGQADPDGEGTVLRDVAAARVEAVRFAVDSVSDRPELILDGCSFRVEVSDEAGSLLCTVIVLAMDAPAAREGVRCKPLLSLVGEAAT